MGTQSKRLGGRATLNYLGKALLAGFSTSTFPRPQHKKTRHAAGSRSKYRKIYLLWCLWCLWWRTAAFAGTTEPARTVNATKASSTLRTIFIETNLWVNPATQPSERVRGMLAA